jgi:hypothetical protein
MTAEPAEEGVGDRPPRSLRICAGLKKMKSVATGPASLSLFRTRYF